MARPLESPSQLTQSPSCPAKTHGVTSAFLKFLSRPLIARRRCSNLAARTSFFSLSRIGESVTIKSVLKSGSWVGRTYVKIRVEPNEEANGPEKSLGRATVNGSAVIALPWLPQRKSRKRK